VRRRAEHDQPAILQDQRNAERGQDLTISSGTLGLGGAGAGDAGDDKAMEQPSERENDRPGEEGGDDRSTARTQECRQPAGGGQVERRIHTQHQKVALGEIDHPHCAEDDAEPDTHQRIGASDQDAGGERLQEIDKRKGHGATI